MSVSYLNGQVVALLPKHCVWELTLECNLRCKHCGSRAGVQRPNELSTNECLSVVDQLSKLGCEIITLSGGEPTLHKDWYTIACAIRNSGMIVNMVTNGYVLDEDTAYLMKKAGLANVGISLDGTEKSHDIVRRKGSFKRSLKSLEILKNAGVKTAVLTTINKHNIDQLDDIHNLLVNINVNEWRLHLGKPMGNMKANIDLVVKPDDLIRLLPALLRIKENSPFEVGIGDSVGYHSIYDAKLRAFSWDGKPQCWKGCQAGLKVIGIESDGNVKGCLSMQPDGNKRDQFTEGNIRTRSLESIWFDKNCFSYNRDFSCNQLTGFCRKCQYRFSCRGGAKCMAIASTGTTLENPYCYFQVSQLNKKQSDLTHRKFIAATAATTLLFLGGYPGKVVAQEKTLYSQSGQSVENNVNNDSVERPGQGAITTQSIPPDDCIGVVYGINPPPQLGSLSGNVFATENEVSDNIVGAMITISNEYKEYIGISDSNGTFSIPDILVGEYNVKVEKVGFEEYMLEETWICTNKNTELPGIELVKSFPWELFYPAFIKKK